ncbi:MAG: TolC family protein [Proteobacteria bacterium]|nr:TolC family protein [Pseudomonadota bacterium]
MDAMIDTLGRRRGPWRLVLLTVMLLPAALAGCARYVPRPIDAASSAGRLAARRLDDAALRRFLAAMGHPAPRWGIGTLTLVAVFERPDLRIAVAGQAIAQGGLVAATALPNPTLGLSPTFNTGAGLPSPIKIGPIVDFVIDSFGARAADAAAARANIAVARAAIRTATWQERARVRDALLAVWQARAQAAIADRAARTAAASGIVLNQRFAAGMIAAPVLTAGQITAEQAGFAAAEAARRTALASTRLAAAIGMPAAALRGIPLDFAAFDTASQPQDVAPLARAALIERPAVRAALASYLAAQDRLRAAIDRQYPGFTIGPGYHYDQGDNKFLLALSVPLPVFNQNQGPIAIARADRRRAAARFDAAQQNVLAMIDQARADLRASQAAMRAADRSAAGADRTAAAAAQAFRAGASGRLGLLGARQAAIVARQDALTARAQDLAAIGRLEDALHHRFFRSNP